MKVGDIVSILEGFAPLALQEDYDNSGLIVGSKDSEVDKILLSIDVTPEVVREAISKGANLIIAHHPIVFRGLKRFNGSNYVERVVLDAIKNDIAIYASHTNIDSVEGGVSYRIAQRLGLEDVKILRPINDNLVKLVTFVPNDFAQKVRDAIFSAGAGVIGNYDSCSYNVNGFGSFRANETTNPFVGQKGEIHFEPEVRVETIVPRHLLKNCISALLNSHPYEEVAYDVYPIELPYPKAGLGAVGVLPKPVEFDKFLLQVKQKFNAKCVRFTNPVSDSVSKVAICGGSGIELLRDAIASGAQVFITADVKYHQFFDAENRISIVDIGHFESEQFTVDIFYDLLTKKLSNFAILKSEVNTNPINYI
jgi:dinuclear metal center YbgI/SA1388 family protein